MSGLCSETDHPDADSIIYLLSLNDSLLIRYNNKHNTSNLYDMPEFRRRLIQILLKKVPGRLLVECIAHNWLWTIVPIFIISMGSIGNCLSAIVLCRRSMSQISTYIFLATLAVVDEIILLSGLFRKWMEHVTQRSLENHFLSFCKLFQVIGVSSSIVSVWLIVTLTMERVLIIKRPFEASKYAKASRAKYIILILMLVSFIISCHFFETVTLIDEDNRNFTAPQTSQFIPKCQFKVEYVAFVKVWFFIDGAFYSWIPLILLIITNVIILLEIYKARNIHNLMTNSQNDEVKKPGSSIIRAFNQRRHKECSTRNRETRQLTVMLLIISLSFLLTTSPLVILKLLIKLKGIPKEIQSQAKLILLDTIFEMLMYINHAINFYLYCATGNKFRKQLMKMVFCKRHQTFTDTFQEKMGKYFTINNRNLQQEETMKESICLKESINKLNN